MVTANVLEEPRNLGPTRDWSGPELPLDSKEGPVVIAKLLCDIIAEAAKKNANQIRLNLLGEDANVNIEYQSREGSEQSPQLPGNAWSGLVTSIPRFASIESCQGVLTDPATKVKWRFKFSKESGSLVLSKVESEGTETDQ